LPQQIADFSILGSPHAGGLRKATILAKSPYRYNNHPLTQHLNVNFQAQKNAPKW